MRIVGTTVGTAVVGSVGATVGTDEIGTLQLRCGSLFAGYWNHGGDDNDVSSDGWFTTRDRFMLDAHGMYHHCGRVDDLFKVGGKWVSPGEVERALVIAVALAAGLMAARPATRADPTITLRYE